MSVCSPPPGPSPFPQEVTLGLSFFVCPTCAVEGTLALGDSFVCPQLFRPRVFNFRVRKVTQGLILSMFFFAVCFFYHL